MKNSVNPFLDDAWMPNYAAMTPELCEQALREALPKAERAFAFVEKQLDISWRGLVLAPMQALRAPFSVWSILSHLTSVIQNEAWRKVEETWQPAIIELGQKAAQSRRIYEGLLALLESDTLLPWQRHVVEREVATMRNAGVGLRGSAKTAFNRIQKELAKLSLRFANNVLDAEKETKIEVAPEEAAGIPKDLLSGKGPWQLGIDFATYDAVMRYAEDEDLRQRFWHARVTRASSGKINNAPLIEKILSLRQQEAELLGYPDYAHLSTATKMAGTPQAVLDLLSPMIAVGKPAAKAEDAELAKFAKAQGFIGNLRPWDKAYWIEKHSQALFGYDEEALRDYFPMEHVLSGLFALIEKLLGVTFARETKPLRAWHKDVRFYRVLDAQGQLLAGFYFDPYARPGTKSGGAWMNEIHTRDFETRQQLPIAVICCNQKPPRAKAPATMSFYEVVTLFHEMGHALQEMLTTVDSPTCSGINNVAWDAVEIASQFLEQFPYEPELLRSLSKHIENGKPLPKDLAARIVAKRTYRAGSALVRQLVFAYTDLTLHAKAYPKRYANANACKEAFAKKFLPKPMHPADRFLNAFTHIFAGGYAAGYYSYKWSEVLSADIYGAFAGQTAAKRKALGKRYRQTLLAKGGSEPAGDIFRELMGRDPDTSAILRLTGLLK
ncbi:MAG: M3 family metallopeptidase [Candidatus Spyradenecus sp.]